MKTYLLFFFGIVLLLINCNNEDKATTNKTEIQSGVSAVEGKASATEIVGQWKKIAYGEDANKNGILEDIEKEKRPEPGSYETLNFYNGGTYMCSGILGELKGAYEVKNVKGKKMILMYSDDMPSNLSEEKKIQWATKMEIRSLEADKLVVVPPIYVFMLVVYTRVK